MTLTDARHIPDLTKNLISLGTLEAKRCKYLAKYGVLELPRMVILPCWQGDQEIYILQGSTITSAVAVTTVLSSQTNRTKLWHLRMGNLSEKGMTILSRKGVVDL